MLIEVEVDPQIPPDARDENSPLPSGMAILVLRDKQTDAAIPLRIGIPEADSIHIGFLKNKRPRPMTHDLMKSILFDRAGIVVTKAVVTEFKDNMLYALLYLKCLGGNGEEFKMTCRPGDAIALALRFDAPICVEEKLWVEILASEEAKEDLKQLEE